MLQMSEQTQLRLNVTKPFYGLQKFIKAKPQLQFKIASATITLKKKKTRTSEDKKALHIKSD